MAKRLSLLLVPFAAPVAVIATQASGNCNHNNCLRAVIASAFPARSGAADCGSFMDVTVTPATLTFTETVTAQTESVVPWTVTESSTTFRTVTASTESQTTTEVRTQGQTKIVRAGTTRTTTVPVVFGRGQEPQGGAVTAGGATFPAYASACTSYAKYSSACSCVGVTAKTVTAAAPSVTVTETATSTSATRTTAVATETLSRTIDVSVTDTTVVTVFSTISTTTTSTSTSTSVRSIGPTNIFKNGNFEYGGWGPWIETKPREGETVRRIVGGVAQGAGADGGHAAVVTGMWNNDLWEFRQEFYHQRNVRYRCGYDWKYTNHYETVYENGNTYVPYIHGYLNNQLWTTDIPDNRPQRVDEWQTTAFTFRMSWDGWSTWWFDCASPQAPDGEGGGNNTLYIDNVYCIPDVAGG
ncbi:hypothetical protein RB595_008361 [Gaeumannomyces hyphopodioides]